MAKISTIPEMEQFLLSKSSTDDLLFGTDGRGTQNKILSHAMNSNSKTLRR